MRALGIRSTRTPSAHRRSVRYESQSAMGCCSCCLPSTSIAQRELGTVKVEHETVEGKLATEFETGEGAIPQPVPKPPFTDRQHLPEVASAIPQPLWCAFHHSEATSEGDVHEAPHPAVGHPLPACERGEGQRTANHYVL